MWTTTPPRGFGKLGFEVSARHLTSREADGRASGLQCAMAVDLGRGTLVLLVAGLAGCPARKQQVQPVARPIARDVPRPCAELSAMLVGGHPPREIILQVTGRGTAVCDVDLRDLELRYHAGSGTLAKTKLSRLPRRAIAPNAVQRMRLVVRLPSDPPNCRVTLTGTQVHRDRGKPQVPAFRGPLSQSVACGAEVAQ